MWDHSLHQHQIVKPFEVAKPYLLQQVKPFIPELTAAGDHTLHVSTPCNPAALKLIPTTSPLRMNHPKVFRNAPHRSPGVQEANQLRMPFVRIRLPPQHRLGQQRFTPERNKSLRIQIFRMQRPESHFFPSGMSARRSRYEGGPRNSDRAAPRFKPPVGFVHRSCTLSSTTIRPHPPHCTPTSKHAARLNRISFGSTPA